MQTRTWGAGLATILLAACVSPAVPTTTGATDSGAADARPGTEAAPAAMAGWYSQDPTHASFQPCGDAQALQVVDGDALRQRAARFGLVDGDPVYVEITGVRRATSVVLDRIDQFGSPTPVRDCPMTGTRIQG